MRFYLRLIVLALLVFSLVVWRQLLRSQPHHRGDDPVTEVKDDFPLTFDTFLHVQQLRKKRLRSFCSSTNRVAKLLSNQQEATRVLSRIRLNTQLDFLYCQVPAIGLEGWEWLLQMLEEKANVTVPVLVPHHQQRGKEKQLSKYDLTAIEAMLRSYTKVLFIRDPFQRLISAYTKRMTNGQTFSEFTQSILDGGLRNASIEWRPLVSLCRPCLIQYDYVIMFGFLSHEVHHLFYHAGLPQDIHFPEFTDSQIRWTYSWLSEQLFSELSLTQRRRLSYFYRWDFDAFQFSTSLLRDFPSSSSNQ